MPLEDVRLAAGESRRAAPAPGCRRQRPPTAPALDWRDIPVFIVNRQTPRAMVRLIDWLRPAARARSSSSTTPRPTRRCCSTTTRCPGREGAAPAAEPRPLTCCGSSACTRCWTRPMCDRLRHRAGRFCPPTWSAGSHETLQRYPTRARSARHCASTTCPTAMPTPTPCASGRASSGSTRWRRAYSPRPSTPPSRSTLAKAAFSIDDRALRLGRPVVEHTPWYAIEGPALRRGAVLPRARLQTFSNWSVRGKQSSTYLSERVQRFDQRPAC